MLPFHQGDIVNDDTLLLFIGMPSSLLSVTPVSFMRSQNVCCEKGFMLMLSSNTAVCFSAMRAHPTGVYLMKVTVKRKGLMK